MCVCVCVSETVPQEQLGLIDSIKGPAGLVAVAASDSEDVHDTVM